jgi:hypothetical protein
MLLPTSARMAHLGPARNHAACTVRASTPWARHPHTRPIVARNRQVTMRPPASLGRPHLKPSPTLPRAPGSPAQTATRLNARHAPPLRTSHRLRGGCKLRAAPPRGMCRPPPPPPSPLWSSPRPWRPLQFKTPSAPSERAAPPAAQNPTHLGSLDLNAAWHLIEGPHPCCNTLRWPNRAGESRRAGNALPEQQAPAPPRVHPRRQHGSAGEPAAAPAAAAPPQVPRLHAVVVGAGPAGVTAAIFLARRGWKVGNARVPAPTGPSQQQLAPHACGSAGHHMAAGPCAVPSVSLVLGALSVWVEATAAQPCPHLIHRWMSTSAAPRAAPPTRAART